MIYLDLIFNLTLLVALTVVSGFIENRWPRHTRAGVMIQGLLFGVAAVIGMLRPLNLGPGLIFDGRSVMVSLCALFFGPWAASVAGGLTIGCRIFLGGVGTLAGVLVVLSSAAIGLATHYYLKPERRPPSTRDLFLFGLVVHLAMLAMMFALPQGAGPAVVRRMGPPVLLLFPLATILAGKILSDQAAARQRMAALAESEHRFVTIFRKNPMPAALSKLPDGRLTEVNDAWCEFMGHEREEVLGRPVGELGMVDADTHRRLTEAFYRDGYLKNAEVTITTGRGEEKEILCFVDPMTIGGEAFTIHMIVDITERKRAETALSESQRRYRNLFDNHVAVKLILDPDTGAIVDANPAAERFYGWTRDQLKGMRIQEINTLSDESVTEAIETARNQKRIRFEFRHRLRDGSTREVEVFSSRINDGGKAYLHSIVHDITEQRNLEEQLRQSQKVEAIGRLAGGVAHDFNNMLSIIIGYGEHLLEELPPQEPLRTEVGEIVAAGKRSAGLTRQLLAFSRKQTLKPEVLDLNEVVRNLEKMLGRLIGEDIALTFDLSKEPAMAMADPGQMEQVIMNLAVNARDAMPRGGRLTIQTGHTELDEDYARDHVSVRPGEYVMLAVADTGSGMDRETRSKLFEPFFTTKEKGKGTGLGLASVYGIVKQSGGNIWVYSEPNRGTIFKIYLPKTEAAPEVVAARPEREPKPRMDEGILIAEDDPALRKLCERMVSRLGYRATPAADAAEALRLINEEELTPDLLLTDVVMPDMSGPELAERLRQIRPELKVLYMSGYTDNAIVHHGVLDPGTNFIEKPFTARDLEAKILEALGAGAGSHRSAGIP